MNRLKTFLSFEHHPMHGKPYRKLTKDDLKIAVLFLIDTVKLTHEEFGEWAVRYFLDLPNKPKNWNVIVTLWLEANSTVKNQS